LQRSILTIDAVGSGTSIATFLTSQVLAREIARDNGRTLQEIWADFEEQYLTYNPAIANVTSTGKQINFNWETTSIAGCTDENACNYYPFATDDDGSCYTCAEPGCYNCPESCPPCTPAGCIDPMACNYSAYATIDDGSCNYDCTTPNDATCNSALETYPWLNNYLPGNTCTEIVDYYDGSYWHYVYVKSGNEGNIYLNYNGDGFNYGSDNGNRDIANSLGLSNDVNQWSCGCNGTGTNQISGCMDSEACNYNPLANVDDGTCNYGCLTPSGSTCNLALETYPWLNNYLSDNSCTEVVDYYDGSYWHYVYVKSGNEGNIYLDYNGDGINYGSDNGNRDIANSLGLSNIFNQWSCGCSDSETNQLLGCVDSEACNYNPLANVDDGTCNYDCHPPNGSTCNPALETYPWLSNYLSGNTCTEVVDYYDGNYWHYIYVKKDNEGILYLNYNGDGTTYGSDAGNRTIAGSYGLNNVVDQWFCGCDDTSNKTESNYIHLKPKQTVAAFNLYPNPSTGKVFIELNQSIKASLKVDVQR